MLCAHCNDELDPTEHNCCEACDLQDALRARVAELEAELPDDYSESKDWRHGNAVSRIQWLKAMLEATRGEVERLESQF